MTLKIELEREVDGRWIAEFGEIPGVLCYGDTPPEAAARAEALGLRAIADRTEEARAAEETIPKSTELEA